MKMVKDFLLRFKSDIKSKLANEEERIRLQFYAVFLLLGTVSLFMTLLNLLTGYRLLMYSTLVFGLLNFLNVLLASKPFHLYRVTEILFGAEFIALLTFFLIVGEPEGFSVIWAALLPACGMLLYRRKVGSILSGIQFLILAFFCWTPVGNGMLYYEGYTDSFLLRFPFLYLAFFFAGYTFEIIRVFTQEELAVARDKYVALAHTDTLTGLGNETLYYETVSEIEHEIQMKKAEFAIFFMDVNGVKATNDSHGHRFGCHLIVTAGKTLPSIFPTSRLFHIGGDEFVAIIEGEDYEHIGERIEDFEQRMSYHPMTYEGVDIILSVAGGYALYNENVDAKYNDVLQRADDQMYENKCFIKKRYQIAER